MNAWTRADTRIWIRTIESRLDDIDYYLDQTNSWCEEYGIDDPKTYFMANFLTCIWVSQMRGEYITFGEIMEMLGIDEWECDEEKIYELDPEYECLDHGELLKRAIAHFGDEDPF